MFMLDHTFKQGVHDIESENLFLLSYSSKWLSKQLKLLLSIVNWTNIHYSSKLIFSPYFKV